MGTDRVVFAVVGFVLPDIDFMIEQYDVPIKSCNHTNPPGGAYCMHCGKPIMSEDVNRYRLLPNIDKIIDGEYECEAKFPHEVLNLGCTSLCKSPYSIVYTNDSDCDPIIVIGEIIGSIPDYEYRSSEKLKRLPKKLPLEKFLNKHGFVYDRTSFGLHLVQVTWY